MKTGLIGLVLTVALHATAAHALDSTTQWAYGYTADWHPSWQAAEALDAYKASLATKAPAELGSELAASRAGWAASCAAGSALVGLSAVAETLPVAGMISKLLTSYDTGIETAVDFSLNDIADGSAAAGLSTIMGAAVSGVGGLIRVPFAYLKDGKVDRPFLFARTAYEGTRGLDRDLLWRDSACAKFRSKIGMIKAEQARRQAADVAAAAIEAQAGGSKTVAAQPTETDAQIMSQMNSVRTAN